MGVGTKFSDLRDIVVPSGSGVLLIVDAFDDGTDGSVDSSSCRRRFEEPSKLWSSS